jgi:phosphate acyltransferase
MSIRIAFDVMGSELGVKPAIESSRKFKKDYPDTEIILFGVEKEIQKFINPKDNFKIVDCSEYILASDNVLSVIRSKKDSSLIKAIESVIDNKADAIISAASTPHFVSCTFLKMKTIKDNIKPSFMPWIPTVDQKGFIMTDVGANKECSGLDLYNFALMANTYSKNVLKIDNPRIYINNIGEEKNKGKIYHQEADKLLSDNNSINYLGFKEPKNLLDGGHDIIICDGYSGNLVLKTLEGTMKTMSHTIRSQLKKPINILGALFALPALKKVSKIFDYRNNAGAIVLGLKHIAVKTHGSADEVQYYSTLRMARDCVINDIIGRIKDAFKDTDISE